MTTNQTTRIQTLETTSRDKYGRTTYRWTLNGVGTAGVITRRKKTTASTVPFLAYNPKTGETLTFQTLRAARCQMEQWAYLLAKTTTA